MCDSDYYSQDADISFLTNPPKNWGYVNPSIANSNGNTTTNTFDFFSIALHELGHASLLRHVNDTTDLMYCTTYDGYLRGSISNNDLDGGLNCVLYSQTYKTAGCIPFKIPAQGSAICVSPASGIETIGNNIFELSVYPNPTSHVLNVTFIKQKESNNTVKLINITGQTVFYRNIGRNEGANEVINLDGVAKGIYMLIVTDDANTVCKKIIVE